MTHFLNMRGKKLLVADDSLTIQKVIRLALSNESYEIQAINNGDDAIQQISLFRPDVVLIDVSLPGKSGFEVKRAINELEDLEEVRFILLSSAFEEVDEAQVKEVGFHDRLTKPFDPAQLRQVLTNVLEQVTKKRLEQTPLSASPPPPEFNMPTAPDETADWLDPVKPEEPPLMKAPESEALHDLWEKEPEVFSASNHQSGEDSDIKHLTESTIRMSGLDELQWSVNEPSLKPPPRLSDDGGTSFQFEEPVEQVEQPALEVAPPPVPPQIDANVIPVSHTDIQEIIRREVEAALGKMAQQILPELAEKTIKSEIHRMLMERP